MAYVGQQQSITTTASIIFAGNNQISDPLPVTIKNQDSALSIFLGGPTVTTTTGYELKAGQPLNFQVVATDTLYGIVASGTVRLDVLKGRS